MSSKQKEKSKRFVASRNQDAERLKDIALQKAEPFAKEYSKTAENFNTRALLHWQTFCEDYCEYNLVDGTIVFTPQPTFPVVPNVLYGKIFLMNNLFK